MDTTDAPQAPSLDDRPPLTGFTAGGQLTGWFADPILQCVAFIVVVSGIFIALPGIDVWFSGLFTVPKAPGFPVASLPAFQILRNANRLLTWIIPIALIVVMIVKLARPDRPSLVAPAKSFFLLLTLAVGPGLVTNLLFKDHWGRPRPENVDFFGGTLPFVEAWRVTNYCVANCSFISGEASSAAWLLGLAVLVPSAWRPAALKWLTGFAILVSLDRIAFGGHFLSDVLLGWGFTLLIMAIAYRFLIERPIPWLSNESQEDRWTSAGVAVRRRLGFPTPEVTDADPALLTAPQAVSMPLREHETDSAAIVPMPPGHAEVGDREDADELPSEPAPEARIAEDIAAAEAASEGLEPVPGEIIHAPMPAPATDETPAPAPADAGVPETKMEDEPPPQR